jgi:hypothetical protein
MALRERRVMSYSTRYTGVSNLLAPDNCTMILIDHQPLQFAGVQNIDRTLLVR